MCSLPIRVTGHMFCSFMILTIPVAVFFLFGNESIIMLLVLVFTLHEYGSLA